MKTINLTTIPFLIVNFLFSIFVTTLMIITFINGDSEWYYYLISIIAFLLSGSIQLAVNLQIYPAGIGMFSLS